MPKITVCPLAEKGDPPPQGAGPRLTRLVGLRRGAGVVLPESERNGGREPEDAAEIRTRGPPVERPPADRGLHNKCETASRFAPEQ